MAPPHGRSDELDPGLLAKVRALLAKAESTTFEPEAEALTAKAQQLMARHRIDAAMVDAGGPAGSGDESGVIRRELRLDAPYAREKAFLVTEVGAANGVRVVWSRPTGSVTLVGFGVDLAVTEELFTSLLVQATTALARHGRRSDRRGATRTTSFRRSFLLAFSHRIGERLQAATEAVIDEAGVEVLPVLAGRAERVETVVAAAFPRLASATARAHDAEGWQLGLVHADRADLASGPAVGD